MKYIVMESKRSYAILLDEDGRFVTAANLRYEVGQIVENPVLMVDSSGHRMRRRGLAAALAALLVVLILLLAGILWYQNFSTPYASVYFSVNPEVEAEINESGRVIDLEGRNGDGEDLIEDYHFWGKEKEEVISDLVSRARDMGYLTGGDTVLLRIDTPDDASFAEYESDLRGATAAFRIRLITCHF